MEPMGNGSVRIGSEQLNLKLRDHSAQCALVQWFAGLGAGVADFAGFGVQGF